MRLAIAYSSLFVILISAWTATRTLRDDGTSRWMVVALIVFAYPIGLLVWVIRLRELHQVQRAAQP